MKNSGIIDPNQIASTSEIKGVDPTSGVINPSQIASTSSVGKGKKSSGFLGSISDALGQEFEKNRDALRLLGISGGSGEHGGYSNWKEAAADALRGVSTVASMAIGGPQTLKAAPILMNALKQGLVGAVPNAIANKLTGEPVKNALISGGVQAGVAAGLPFAGKGVALISPKLKGPAVTGLSKAGEMFTGNSEEAYSKVLAHPELFKGPNSKTKVIEGAAQSAKSAFDNISKEIERSQQKISTINKAKLQGNAKSIIEAYKNKSSEVGQTIGVNRQRLIDQIKDKKIDTSDLINQIDNIIETNHIPDPTGAENRLTNSEISVLQDIKSRLSPKTVYDPISEKKLKPFLEAEPELFKNPKNLESLSKQLGIKGSKETVPISAAKLDNIISDINDRVKYYPNLTINEKSSTGEAILKNLQRSLNERLGEVSPDLVKSKFELRDLKDVKRTLGSQLTSQKSIASLLEKYHSGKLSNDEMQALENLEKITEKPFLYKSKPLQEPENMATLRDLTSSLSSLKNPKTAISTMKGFHDLPAETQNALLKLEQVSGKHFVAPLINQLLTEPFYKLLPSSGKTEAGLAKNILRMVTGATHIGAAPLFSPAAHRLAIQGASKLAKAAPVTNAIAQRFSPAIVGNVSNSLLNNR